jgi:hypothetical protein
LEDEDPLEVGLLHLDSFPWKNSHFGHNLRTTHIIVIDWYCMCKKSEKTPDHLLLHCDATRELWIMVFQFFGVEWVMPRWVVDLLASWKRRVGRNDINFVWNAILSFLM